MHNAGFAMTLPAYDITRSYDWNYENAPSSPPEVHVPPCPGRWTFCGMPVNSPLGIPAGPLLNARWILFYAALGFDVLTYKTVRTRFRACYDPPNLLPVAAAALGGEGLEIEAAPPDAPVRSWAISFGMPSKAPSDWRADVERARLGLARGQLLVVSVVASPETGWSMSRIAADFAQCAGWAAASGAHAIDANLSCPNVCTQEGDLYLSPEASRAVAEEIRSRVTDLPLILKIGLFHNRT